MDRQTINNNRVNEKKEDSQVEKIVKNYETIGSTRNNKGKANKKAVPKEIPYNIVPIRRAFYEGLGHDTDGKDATNESPIVDELVSKDEIKEEQSKARETLNHLQKNMKDMPDSCSAAFLAFEKELHSLDKSIEEIEKNSELTLEEKQDQYRYLSIKMLEIKISIDDHADDFIGDEKKILLEDAGMLSRVFSERADSSFEWFEETQKMDETMDKTMDSISKMLDEENISNKNENLSTMNEISGDVNRGDRKNVGVNLDENISKAKAYKCLKSCKSQYKAFKKAISNALKWMKQKVKMSGNGDNAVGTSDIYNNYSPNEMSKLLSKYISDLNDNLDKQMHLIKQNINEVAYHPEMKQLNHEFKAKYEKIENCINGINACISENIEKVNKISADIQLISKYQEKMVEGIKRENLVPGENKMNDQGVDKLIAKAKIEANNKKDLAQKSLAKKSKGKEPALD